MFWLNIIFVGWQNHCKTGSGCHLHRPEEKISGSGFLDVRSGFLDVRRPEIWMSGLPGSGCCGPRPEKKYLDLDVCMGPDLDLDACLDPDMDLPSVATMAPWHHQAHPRQWETDYYGDVPLRVSSQGGVCEVWRGVGHQAWFQMIPNAIAFAFALFL